MESWERLTVSEQGFSVFPMLWAFTHPSRLQTRLFRVLEATAQL